LTVEIMHDLGVMNNFHVSPIFNPIQLPKKDSFDVNTETPPTVPTPAKELPTKEVAEKESETKKEPEDPNLTKIDKNENALMEVSAKVHKAVYGCKKLEAEGKKDACSAGYNKAYEIYELGLSYVRMNKVEFEEERRVLGSFREELKQLIALKLWRINYMEKQKKALVASIDADAAAPIEAILKKIKEHKEIITTSCADMQTRSKEAQAELADIEKVVDQMYTKGATGATGTAEPVKEPVDTAQENKKAVEGPSEEKKAPVVKEEPEAAEEKKAPVEKEEPEAKKEKAPAEQEETVINKP